MGGFATFGTDCAANAKGFCDVAEGLGETVVDVDIIPRESAEFWFDVSELAAGDDDFVWHVASLCAEIVEF